nr:uncharacterized mitochondrial protein AtMg00810-like [Tanacetum cinerariifolium]
FNKRTRRVEENLHVEFLENKAIEKSAGPNLLFDIDSLTNSMNYVPVDAGTNSTNFSGTKVAANQEVKKDVSSLRYIVLFNGAHYALLESSSSKPHVESSTQVPEGSGNLNPSVSSSNPPADQMETLIVESPIPTVSSPVPTACLNDSPEPSVKQDLFQKEVTTSSDEAIGVEADVSNMETTISASPTPTLRIYKDHPNSQIIGPVDTPIQTKHKSKEVSDALQDLSWVEAMQEELLQFKIQKVWTLVDCPKGVRPIGTKWVQKNKKDERGIVVKNKARLGKDGTGKDVELHLYRSMIGSLMYLTASRLDIMFAVCACARHQVSPKECHLHAVKRIFQYLKGHPKLGFWYPKASPFDLVAYSDSDYGGASQDRKSTTRGSQFLDRRLISWQCKKQTIVATSTTKAEYVAAASCCGQVLWIQNQLLDYG